VTFKRRHARRIAAVVSEMENHIEMPDLRQYTAVMKERISAAVSYGIGVVIVAVLVLTRVHAVPPTSSLRFVVGISQTIGIVAVVMYFVGSRRQAKVHKPLAAALLGLVSSSVLLAATCSGLLFSESVDQPYFYEIALSILAALSFLSPFVPLGKARGTIG
jgi:uncharacterized membrane protein